MRERVDGMILVTGLSDLIGRAVARHLPAAVSRNHFARGPLGITWARQDVGLHPRVAA